jgi:hypothetical protein
MSTQNQGHHCVLKIPVSDTTGSYNWKQSANLWFCFNFGVFLQNPFWRWIYFHTNIKCFINPMWHEVYKDESGKIKNLYLGFKTPTKSLFRILSIRKNNWLINRQETKISALVLTYRWIMSELVLKIPLVNFSSSLHKKQIKRDHENWYTVMKLWPKKYSCALPATTLQKNIWLYCMYVSVIIRSLF